MVAFAVLLALASCIASSEALKCYGAEAFQRAHSGERDCYRRFEGGFWEPCWSKCGGVTKFTNTGGDDDPSGKELCPYREDGQPGYSSVSSKVMPCNCSMWRQPLPGGKCPKCDDFNAVSPLMITTSRDAAAAGIELGACPPGFDTCFNYCVNIDKMRREFYTQCAYGCANMANKAILDLMIATKLSELDQKRMNPVEYVCEAWSYECTEVFCNADGCNQLATLPKLGGWAHVYDQRWAFYLSTSIVNIIAIGACSLGLYRTYQLFVLQYTPI
jgi:hypothetical protein